MLDRRKALDLRREMAKAGEAALDSQEANCVLRGGVPIRQVFHLDLLASPSPPPLTSLSSNNNHMLRALPAF